MTYIPFPEVSDPRAEVVSIIPLFTESAERQQVIVASLERAWQATLPAGLVSAHCFASVGGESVLLFLQWSGEQAVRALQSNSNDELRSLGLEPFGNANSPIYRRYRSLGGAATGQQASSLICAYFDTDGPERQRHIADTLIELASALPENPAALAAHFYHSLDGTRVINYTEWDDARAHDVQADEGAYEAIYEASTATPGVRSLRGNQYQPVAYVLAQE